MKKELVSSLKKAWHFIIYLFGVMFIIAGLSFAFGVLFLIFLFGGSLGYEETILLAALIPAFFSGGSIILTYKDSISHPGIDLIVEKEEDRNFRIDLHLMNGSNRKRNYIEHGKFKTVLRYKEFKGESDTVVELRQDVIRN